MQRGILAALWASCLVLLASCSWPQPDPKLEAMAQMTYEQVRAGDFDAVVASAIPSLADVPREQLEQVKAMIPPQEPDSLRLIGYREHHRVPENVSTYALTYEYHWRDNVALVNAGFVKGEADPKPLLNNFDFRMASREELRANDFHLLGKPLGHYLMLLAVIATPLLMIYAIVLSIRTPGLKRRWLWCIVSLATVCEFNFDWTNSAFQWVLLKVSIINVGISRADTLFASWVLSTAIPIGAVIVIVRLRRRLKAAEKEAAASAPGA